MMSGCPHLPGMLNAVQTVLHPWKTLCRSGSLILELAPVSPESANSMASRSYVWDKKQVRPFP